MEVVHQKDGQREAILTSRIHSLQRWGMSIPNSVLVRISTMRVIYHLSEVIPPEWEWVHTCDTLPASEQNSTGLVYQCCAHHQPRSPFLCQALGAVARPLCIIAKTTNHGTYFKPFLEIKLRKRNVFRMSQCSEREHSIMSDTHWSPKIAFSQSQAYVLALLRKNYKPLIILGTWHEQRRMGLLFYYSF